MDKQLMEIFTELRKEIKEIKEMLNKIEREQTGEDTNMRTESELEFLNKRILQIDKRIFFLEKQSIYRHRSL